ncbi:hypothetical protein [Sulfuriflexus mobilis]|uniref:hypothetical protein n=1 Tax=Sulfuriflexus mobilis TaxID=1811807 RepID=UPI000F840706|nr:hypothetical protein [Sulfuriflexus mobilis]
MKKCSIALLALFAVLNTASAAEYLTADEVRALFTDKTFDGLYLPKDKGFKAYEAPDGSHNVYYNKSGKRSKNRKWSVNEEGQHCTTSKKWPEPRCSYVKNAGDGEYHKINNDGEHTHTLTNFRDGDQL